MLVDRYVEPSNPLFGNVPSFWNTGLWNLYAEEAGLWEVHFNQGDFGHVCEKPTTLGTNYAELQQLEEVSLSSPLGGFKGASSYTQGLREPVTLTVIPVN